MDGVALVSSRSHKQGPVVEIPIVEDAAPDRIADTTLLPDSGRSYYPSPQDWRDEVLYSIMIDRFQPGPDRFTLGDPTVGGTVHGGDLRGITSRLGYLSELGVSTILLTPVSMSPPNNYHGYAPIHLMAVDPRFGRLADLVELVDQAHRRGIRVILDVVINHTGPVFDYADGHSGWKGADAPAPIAERTIDVRPTELADPVHFSRRGVIEDFKDEAQASLGDFPPAYRRIATENACTGELLKHIVCWWIKETDADGMRVDAVRHIAPDFIRSLVSTVKSYAASLGKQNFLVIGEYSSTADGPIAECFALGLGSAFNYPEYRRQSWALHGKAPTRALQTSFATACAAIGPDLARTVRFIDNHDVYRFLRDGEPAGRLSVAMAFLLFSLGIPMIYYGTEQGFRQATNRLDRECSAEPADPRNREDMFAEGLFVSASSAGDKFDSASRVFRWTRRLVDIRRQIPALRRGGQVVRWSDPDGPGLYAFSRTHDDQEVLVVLNTDEQTRRADIPIGSGLAGQKEPLRDLIDAAYLIEPPMATGSGGELPVTVPPFGVRVLAASKHDRAGCARLGA
jgi:glycosidase